MMISLIVPAHNEEELLGRTLESLRQAAQASGRSFEIIVVDDASTDSTGAVAAEHGATVVNVSLRQIGLVRNAGARAATGQILVFVDADTVVPPETIQAALLALDQGAIGGGATITFDQSPERWARTLTGVWNFISRRMRWAAGCFVFVRREAFDAIGGFDVRYFIGEEVILSAALKRIGKFVILPQRVSTSPRKVQLHGKIETLGIILRLLFSGKKAWQRREGLDLWYRRRTSSDHSSKHR